MKKKIFDLICKFLVLILGIILICIDGYNAFVPKFNLIFCFALLFCIFGVEIVILLILCDISEIKDKRR